MRFHHVALRIRPGQLDICLQLFTRLGFQTFEIAPNHRAAWIGQPAVDFTLQLNETELDSPQQEKRIRSHAAFLDAEPAARIREIESWLAEQGIRCETGGWSDREFWFDCPDLFADFVVEIMHPSVAGEAE